mgnify:CR=1 FL=1
MALIVLNWGNEPAAFHASEKKLPVVQMNREVIHRTLISNTFGAQEWLLADQVADIGAVGRGAACCALMGGATPAPTRQKLLYEVVHLIPLV